MMRTRLISCARACIGSGGESTSDVDTESGLNSARRTESMKVILGTNIVENCAAALVVNGVKVFGYRRVVPDVITDVTCGRCLAELRQI